MGFNDFATDNLWQLLDEQRQATGTVPTDTHVRRRAVPRRTRRLAGDPALPLRPSGARTARARGGATAARALRHRREADRVRRRHHRATARHRGRRRRAPTCSSSTPTRSTRSSPTRSAARRLFASRFRECAARALLLPRRHPGKRSPLWHQRQRAAQLLDVARKYPDFPIVLETVRECLQDVYDVPTLRELMNRDRAAPHPAARGRDRDAVAVRRLAAVRLRRRVHVRGRQPAGRTARRRTVAGQHAARRTARPRRTARAARPAGHRSRPSRSCSTSAEDRAARDAEARRRPAATARPADRGRSRRSGRTADDVGGWLEGLRAAQARADGVVRRADVVGRHRGHRPAARRRRRRRPGRRARRASPNRVDRSARRTARPVRPHPRPVHHRTRPPTGSGWACGSPPTCWAGWRSTASWCAASSPIPEAGEQWCDADVLKILRRRSLAALRAQVEPVSTAAYARFLPAWQQVGSTRSSGIDGLAIGDRTAGRACRSRRRRSSRWCSAQRVRDYQPAMLDELLASGEVTWSGAGSDRQR